jgi:hypothetical protein
MLLAIIQGQPDSLSGTTDCIQSTDYLYTKRDLLLNCTWAFPDTHSSPVVRKPHIVLAAERACSSIATEFTANRPCRTSS